MWAIDFSWCGKRYRETSKSRDRAEAVAVLRRRQAECRIELPRGRITRAEVRKYRELNGVSCLYVVDGMGSGCVKIGRSKKVSSRLLGLQTSFPFPLSVLAVVPEVVVSEEEAHLRWEHLRVGGEWFMRTPEVVGWARRLRHSSM